MKTEDLIARLSADLPDARPNPVLSDRSVMLLALPLALATIALSVVMYGIRVDGPANGLLGLTIWSVLAVFGLYTFKRIRLPDSLAWPTVRAPVLAFVMLLLVLAVLSRWTSESVFRLDYLVHCLQTIGLLACLPFVGFSVLMRRGAPASPVLAGALSGLAAGAIGALAYSVSCPIDDPLASLVTHGLTVLALTGVGALIGWRLYAW